MKPTVLGFKSSLDELDRNQSHLLLPIVINKAADGGYYHITSP